MLSHLRFHRRAPSNPTSPGADQTSYPDAAWTQPRPPFSQDVTAPDARPRSANSSSQPPSLPPITRVTSTDAVPLMEIDPDAMDIQPFAPPEWRKPPSRTSYNTDSGFMGGMALQNYRRGVPPGFKPDPVPNVSAAGSSSHESQFSQPRPAPAPPVPASSSVGPPPPPTRPAPHPTTMPKAVSSFVTPTEIQYQQKEGSASAVVKRPPGTRQATDPSPLPGPVMASEPHRGKKGLPFLKNPMSTLLARRKLNQNIPDLVPLATSTRVQEPTYDPRIRGTRVHDFSAPRPPKKSVSSNDAPVIVVPGMPPSKDIPPVAARAPVAQSLHESQELPPRRRGDSNASESGKSAAAASTTSQSIPDAESASSTRPRRASRLDTKPLPGQPAAPGVPPKDGLATSFRSGSSTHSRAMSADGASTMPRSTPSTRTNQSRNMSLSERPSAEILSSIPKHMKSTSSRFSFDMIGAANQEKLLEERHRQREAEKKTDPRESKYSDFDVDNFDYDAMIDDEGLEERIPGVNVDLEEDDFEAETDPDNDQENFAGFVFQRSNPASNLASALTSPQSAAMMETPRDADGKVIGFAMTKDLTPDLHHPKISPGLIDEQLLQPNPLDPIAGLGIQGLDIKTDSHAKDQEAFQQNQGMLVGMPVARGPVEDDLYFDDGLAEFENEFDGDGEPFDESIFDNNDTDQYGRPIPGAFAQAQLSRSTNQDSSKRESDMMSRLSAQSAVSQSTAHTSLSVGGPHLPSAEDTKVDLDLPTIGQQDLPAPIPGFTALEQEKVAAYQAALAAAAHQAAASGKFRRNSSPPPMESSDTGTTPYDDIGTTFYDDDNQVSGGFDDYEVDDDDIAEANASALASDSDGWYGQEFGFYSAPAPGGHASITVQPFEYSNGGYFGPSGVNRTTSGRMFSREPNLTPITERSEYSNRNSIMSLMVPPLTSGTSSMHSPGLAQLAMMAEGADDGDMTLSALLKLRSKTWGGSQASLVSSRDGSPRSERGDGASSPWGPGAGGFLGVREGLHGRKGSAFSVLSRESEGSASGSPTLTMSVPVITPPAPPVPPVRDGVLSPGISSVPTSTFSPQAPVQAPPPHLFSPQPPVQQAGFPPVLEDEEVDSPTVPPNLTGSFATINSPDVTGPSPKRPGMGHRHKGSADSISYIKEEDSGEIRWVKERRRLADSGEIEILEREVVEGGRI